jgi:hypothetical protein
MVIWCILLSSGVFFRFGNLATLRATAVVIAFDGGNNIFPLETTIHTDN